MRGAGEASENGGRQEEVTDRDAGDRAESESGMQLGRVRTTSVRAHVNVGKLEVDHGAEGGEIAGEKLGRVCHKHGIDGVDAGDVEACQG